MPIYEYECHGCGTRFEQIVQGSTRPACPSCRGTDLEKLLSTFAVGTSTKQMSPSGACGTCGDPRGPGACSIN